MREKKLTRISSLLLSFVLAFGLLCMNVSVVNAKSSKWEIEAPDVLWTQCAGYSVEVHNKNYTKFCTVTGVKSGNPKVLKVEKNTWKDNGKKYTNFILWAKSAGKATITVSYKTPDGKKQTGKKTVVVKKYPKQIKLLKVDGKKVNTNKNADYFDKKTKKTSVNVQLKLKDGWKIQYVDAYAYTSKSGKEVKVTKKMLDKGSKISFPKKYSYMWIYVTMVKGDDTITYTVDFHR